MVKVSIDLAGPAPEEKLIGVSLLHGRASKSRTRLGVMSASVLAVGVTVAISAVRIWFPYDLWIWSESPALTNILKLRMGQPIFGSPADANSFVYSPGLEYLHYAILRPFDAELSVVAHRFLTLSYGLIAALLLSLALRLAIQPRCTKVEVALGFCLIHLAIARGVMSDVIHPDNLYLMILSAVFVMTVRASLTGNVSLAVGAVSLGAMAPFIKQTGALLGLTAAISLLFSNRLSRTQKILATGVALAVTGLTGIVLLRDGHVRFYLLDLVSAHGIEWTRLDRLLVHLIGAPIWIAVLGGLALTLIYVRPPRAWLAAYIVFFALACAPGIAAYLKVSGASNNLVAMQVFLVLGALPAIIYFGWRRRLKVAAAATVVAVPLLMPLKATPSTRMHEYTNELQIAVCRSVERGERLLLAHGTMPLIYAGMRDVPLDRANSALELNMANKGDRTETVQRITNGYYDQIIVNSPNGWYSDETRLALARYYVETDRIKAAQNSESGFKRGMQRLMPDTVVYRRSAEPQSSPDAPELSAMGTSAVSNAVSTPTRNPGHTMPVSKRCSVAVADH